MNFEDHESGKATQQNWGKKDLSAVNASQNQIRIENLSNLDVEITNANLECLLQWLLINCKENPRKTGLEQQKPKFADQHRGIQEFTSKPIIVCMY